MTWRDEERTLRYVCTLTEFNELSYAQLGELVFGWRDMSASTDIVLLSYYEKGRNEHEVYLAHSLTHMADAKHIETCLEEDQPRAHAYVRGFLHAHRLT